VIFSQPLSFFSQPLSLSLSLSLCLSFFSHSHAHHTPRTGNGSLDSSEFRIGLRRLGCDLEMSVLERVMHLFDSDGNGTIDVEEFVSKMTEGDESGGSSSKGEKEEYRLMWLRHFL
jgi:hypothetical protein